MISVLTANRLLRQGCEVFLACVVSSEGSGSNLSDILMVHKFLDVFFQELPRIPPIKEIEFSIDLVSNTRPISKVPYRMPLIELKELNV